MEHSPEFERFARLYREHRITEVGLEKAVKLKVITPKEKEEILEMD